ncbi:polysaccharide deacetylase family protein [Actinomadura barringtoniae]|uniref:Polysaccharide deacetylase family protein n=1 Tax=Actinomadura barringtoniae TaxID=1427535 RepID=A0A939T397_9ACTN|nr:polysaccharide deacetylase family protein [Actinomadura barringtoniae]MBO2446319.1 polysaccharide deacetylase family protein [Actinomadura barringtoniae]
MLGAVAGLALAATVATGCGETSRSVHGQAGGGKVDPPKTGHEPGHETGRPAAAPASTIDCWAKGAKCIALTFDDGPGPYTAKLLDTLKQQNVRATFFVVGKNAKADPDLVKREAAEGHEIENHSMSHPDLAKESKTGLTEQIDGTNDVVKQLTGATPRYLRPPYGATDGQVAAHVKKLGMTQIFWGIDAFDWKHPDASYVSDQIVSDAAPKGIVLLHDIHPTSVDAVPKIIEGLRAKGYTFVTVSELVGAHVPVGGRYGGAPGRKE